MGVDVELHPTNTPFDAATVLSAVRSAVGVASWASPRHTWSAFGMGSYAGDARPAVVTRLFGARELALALAVRHPDPGVRRAALQAGVAIDSIDAVATLIAVRKGAPKVILLTFAAGALTFAALGVAALKQDESRS